MKKWLLLLSASFVLAACGQEVAEPQVDTSADTSTSVVESEVSSELASSETDADLVEVTVSVTEDGELITDGEQVVEVEEGALLLDVMKEHYAITEDGGFISAINGVEQDEDAGKWWMFDVNGAMGETGAAETELQAGDLIEWKLEAFE
ncbi:DUF4430 domain-containing protein [Fundicoccus sp. Sow4_D5]|uniref:DUF4430 domain-containing protein n=1 Tax=Fundicoccus sp. Sow4_D5 TaxID=3438782 RepID=UPI003F913F2F